MIGDLRQCCPISGIGLCLKQLAMFHHVQYFSSKISGAMPVKQTMDAIYSLLLPKTQIFDGRHESLDKNIYLWIQRYRIKTKDIN